MGGLDWQALPLVADVLGVSDLENFINRMLQIRDYRNNANT